MMWTHNVVGWVWMLPVMVVFWGGVLGAVIGAVVLLIRALAGEKAGRLPLS